MNMSDKLKLTDQEREWLELERQLREHPPGSSVPEEVLMIEKGWYTKICDKCMSSHQYIAYAILDTLKISFVTAVSFLLPAGVTLLLHGALRLMLSIIVTVASTIAISIIVFLGMLIKTPFKWAKTKQRMARLGEPLPRTWLGKAAACHCFSQTCV